MSFSNPGYSASLQAAIDYAWSQDIVVVAATGNDGSLRRAPIPAGDRGVIGVSNTDQTDALNASSNYGQDTFLAAPGTDILTTAAGGGYASITGTSASAAEVAAAAALLRANDSSATNGDDRQPARRIRRCRRHGRPDRQRAPQPGARPR